jgi:acyl-CoA synthetase (AMP-forming)/AMP-acid ligase II
MNVAALLDELHFLRVCSRAGLLGIEPPRRGVAIARAMRRYGGIGAIPAVAALRHGERTAIVDERGGTTYAQLDARTNALANALMARGLQAGDGVAILARNHRGLLEALFGCAKAGARCVLLNTDFAGPQIEEVARREGTRLLICDQEYLRLLPEFEPELGRVIAWADEPDARDTLERLIGDGDDVPPPPPESPAGIVILTSGTTGQPKGAPREESRSLAAPGTLLDKIPFRARETTVIAAPLFHSLGLANGVIAVSLGSTVILRRRFNPELALDDVARRRATALIVVPVMLRRMLDAATERDLSTLRIVLVAGSQLGAELARRGAEQFGPVIYNLYGSTEVAVASVATPEDLSIAPDCVGLPPHGTAVRIIDDHDHEAPVDVTGRIFVRSPLSFGGYTTGETKRTLPGGWMASGDLGHVDAEGRLFIDGRDDEMIVSGGENVFPQEVEELLATHPAIVEAAVVGVEDERFGQRLAAYVVARGPLSEAEVKTYVGERLARFKVPREVTFLQELPRNPTGKVVKRLLRQQSSAPAAVRR